MAESNKANPEHRGVRSVRERVRLVQHQGRLNSSLDSDYRRQHPMGIRPEAARVGAQSRRVSKAMERHISGCDTCETCGRDIEEGIPCQRCLARAAELAQSVPVKPEITAGTTVKIKGHQSLYLVQSLPYRIDGCMYAICKRVKRWRLFNIELFFIPVDSLEKA